MSGMGDNSRWEDQAAQQYKRNLYSRDGHRSLDRALNAGIGKRTTGTHHHNFKFAFSGRAVLGLLAALLLAIPSLTQDWIRTGTGLGVEKVRLAVPDFKASAQDPKNTDLLKVFNDTLWNDLDNAGIFDMVSKSFYPLGPVGSPTDVKFENWSAPPPNAAMLAFGGGALQFSNFTSVGLPTGPSG